MALCRNTHRKLATPSFGVLHALIRPSVHMRNSVSGRQLDGMKTPGHKLVSSGKGLHPSSLVRSLVPKAGWTLAERRTEKLLIAATTVPYQSTAGTGPRLLGRGLDGRSGAGWGGAGPPLD